jgi:hypothetical protein
MRSCENSPTKKARCSKWSLCEHRRHQRPPRRKAAGLPSNICHKCSRCLSPTLPALPSTSRCMKQPVYINHLISFTSLFTTRYVIYRSYSKLKAMSLYLVLSSLLHCIALFVCDSPIVSDAIPSHASCGLLITYLPKMTGDRPSCPPPCC